MSTDVLEEPLCVDSPNRSPNQETTTSSSSLVAEPPCALVPSSSNNSAQLFNSLSLPRFVDNTTIQELLIQFYGLLNKTGLESVANLLKTELESKRLIPPRYAFDGRPRQQTFDSFNGQFQACGTDLLQILTRLNEQTNAIIPPSIPNMNIRLFSGPRNSLIRRNLNQKRAFALNSKIVRTDVKSLETCRNTNVLMARELGMPIPTRLLQRKQASTEINAHGRFQGHILPVFCVTFDQTGRYVLTGGDDKIIKVWDTFFGRLRYTFHGHTSEVTDMSINSENTCLASGSNDKTVRCWNTRSGQPLVVYKKHNAMVNMVKFADFVEGEVRYLVSTGNDCTVNFYRYNSTTLKFDAEPFRFEEREAPGARGLVLNCSFGGNFVVMGDSTNHIHIYKLSSTTVDRIAEFRAHEDGVDSLAWANSHLQFATGSKDGVAKVWEFNSGEWTATELRIQEQQPRIETNRSSQQASRKNNAYVLTMLGWSGDDSRVITAGSDKLIRVWNPKTGEMLRKMEGHSFDVFVIKTHPVHSDLVFTAGHDGLIILWDISNGKILWQHKNQFDMHTTTEAIFDLAISPKGDRFAYVDSIGILTLMGVGENRMATNSQHQQFFSNDYDELFFDENGFVQDVDQIPAHLALPALMVNVDSHPYGPEVQRLVPGRDFANPTQVKNPWSRRSILPPISLKQHLINQQERSQIELKEYEDGKPLDDAELQRRREVEKERQRQAHQARLEKQRNRRSQQQHRQQEENEQMRRMMHPQYVLDENYTDSDSTYSGGHESAAELGSDLSGVDEVYEDFDSDYEEGAVEQPTVFRNRSALTVTGRRKKNIRRNTQNDSQLPLEDQPSTSQSAEPQHTTRYGRQSKPPVRIENEFEEKVRPPKKRTVVPPTNLEPVIPRNTRSRRAQFTSESPPAHLSLDDSQTDSGPTRARQQGRQQPKRKTSSTSESGVSRATTESLDLEALEENIDENALTSESSEEESQLNESEDEFDEDTPNKRNKRSTHSPAKRCTARRAQLSESRSPLSNTSDDNFKIKKEESDEDLIDTRITPIVTLRSGRQPKPRIPFGEDESLGRRGHRSSKLSPQRRSARQANHHYSFKDSSQTPPPYMNGTTRPNRRQTNGHCYVESDDYERDFSPVPGPSNVVDKSVNKRSQVPEWMMATERRRFPYIAQIGDVIVYFVQGHYSYIEASKSSVNHQMEKEMAAFEPEECFMVTNIDYLFKDSVIFQYVTLMHLHSNGKPDGKVIKLGFYDLESCPDFLILKQHYEKSRSYEFKQGDRVEMPLLDYVYTGVVKTHQTYSPDFPNSEWLAMLVEWNDGEDRCSIWDLLPAKPGRSANEITTSEDLDELGKYDPQPGDWPSTNSDETPTAARTRYFERCQKAINELNDIPNLKVFFDMVNLDEYPDYFPSTVKRPMYLQLISDRISCSYYRNLLSLKFDIQLIAKNTRRYNVPSSQIVVDADVMIATLFQMLDDFTIESASHLYYQLLNSDTQIPLHHSEKLNPNLDQLNLNESASTNSASTSNNNSWQSQCQSIMDQLIQAHMPNQPTAFCESINEICAEMIRGDFQTPNDFKNALKNVLNNEGSDLSKKERRYIQLTRFMNDVDKQFDAIVAQNARRTRFKQTPTDTPQTLTQRQVEKRVLRSHTQQHSDEPSTSRSKRQRYY
ncbi:Bromo domain-containing protein [Aphelenchoides bicaudatus]|nr:Bromo domain-containing protein [Aphelenchoides bicaudatus]